MSELPDYVSVSIEPTLGYFIKGSQINRVEFDSDELYTTLDMAGEFKNPVHSPLRIVAAAYRNADHPRLAIASALFDQETGLTSEREVVVPLFEAAEVNRGYFQLEADMEDVNSSLSHELQHAADFDNPQIMEEQARYIEKNVKIYHQEKRKIRITEGAVAIGGLFLLSKGLYDPSYFDIATGAALSCIVVGSRRISNNLLRSLRRALYYQIQTKSPLEVRAYDFQDRLRKERIPHIIKLFGEEN